MPPVLQTVEPCHNIVLFLLGYQFFYRGISCQYSLGILGEPLLDSFTVRQIHLQIYHCRLNVLVAQFILDVSYRTARSQHAYRAGVTEAMNRIDHLEPFFR